MNRLAVARLDLGSRAVNEQFGTPKFVGVALSIHSAIHGKICPGDVGGFRTREKSRHCGDLLNMPIAVEGGGGLLRYRPITRSRIQIRVDRTRLDVVDRDAPAPDLSG